MRRYCRHEGEHPEAVRGGVVWGIVRKEASQEGKRPKWGGGAREDLGSGFNGLRNIKSTDKASFMEVSSRCFQKR